MAQSRKRQRRRKHRGTQAGTVERAHSTERRARHGGSASRSTARERRLERFDRPPTWSGAAVRAAIAALLFGVVVVVALKRPLEVGLAWAALMLLIYVPMSYYTDSFIYRRRRRRRDAERAGPRHGAR